MERDIVKDLPADDPLVEWIKTVSEPAYWHPKLVYFGFFYIFKPEILDEKILAPPIAISPAFMIGSYEPYPLTFPSGLDIVGNNVYLTYGEGDIRCKLAIFDINLVLELTPPAEKQWDPSFTTIILQDNFEKA